MRTIAPPIDLPFTCRSRNPPTKFVPLLPIPSVRATGHSRYSCTWSVTDRQSPTTDHHPDLHLPFAHSLRVRQRELEQDPSFPILLFFLCLNRIRPRDTGLQPLAFPPSASNNLQHTRRDPTTPQPSVSKDDHPRFTCMLTTFIFVSMHWSIIKLSPGPSVMTLAPCRQGVGNCHQMCKQPL